MSDDDKNLFSVRIKEKGECSIEHKANHLDLAILAAMRCYNSSDHFIYRNLASIASEAACWRGYSDDQKAKDDTELGFNIGTATVAFLDAAEALRKAWSEKKATWASGQEAGAGA